MLKYHVRTPYDQKALARIERLSRYLGEAVEITVYPDAADEEWGIPTGVLMRASQENALLFPAMLRDPGCGFLVFRLEYGSLCEIHPDLCGLLSDWAETFQDRATGARTLSHLDLPLDEDEKERIVEGFGSIINTLEIRRAYDSASPVITNGDLLGFLHGGCEGFTGVLEQRFGVPAANFTLERCLLPDEVVAQGFFAFPYASAEGQEYARWLQAGMELSRKSRLCSFGALAQFLHALTRRSSYIFSGTSSTAVLKSAKGM